MIIYNPVHDAIYFRATNPDFIHIPNTFATLEHELNISYCDNSLRYKSLGQLHQHTVSVTWSHACAVVSAVCAKRDRSISSSFSSRQSANNEAARGILWPKMTNNKHATLDDI